MRNTIDELTDKIDRLEKQLLDELDAQQEKFKYHLEGTRIKFEQEILDAHRKFKVAILPWLFSSTVRSIISAPFIYAMIIPITLWILLLLYISIYVFGCMA